MRIIARSTLRTYCDTQRGRSGHPALEHAISTWIAEVTQSDWASMADVKLHFRNASVVSNERVIFNIKGNDYRLITAIDFPRRIVFIKWIGTHAEYDRVNAIEVKYEN